MDFLKDPSGKLSEARVLEFSVIIIFMLVWAWISIKQGYMMDIDMSMVAIISVLAGKKGIQSFAEHKNNGKENNTAE